MAGPNLPRMTDDTAHVITSFWRLAEARDWAAFAELLADDVEYRAPQGRELVRGRDAYTRFNAEFPGDWHATVHRVVASGRQGVSWVDFTQDGEPMTGICFFELDGDGRIAALTDFWPDPYEPPANRSHLTERY